MSVKSYKSFDYSPQESLDSLYVLNKPVEVGVKYCSNCGSILDLDTVFCQNSSEKQ